MEKVYTKEEMRDAAEKMAITGFDLSKLALMEEKERNLLFKVYMRFANGQPVNDIALARALKPARYDLHTPIEVKQFVEAYA